MKKVLVIGSSGAGKSTFSRTLGEATGLPVIHLDKLYWSPNWVEPPKDEWAQTVQAALRGTEWILDGNYSGTLEMRLKECDTVIFLDLPRLLCIYRIVKRFLKYHKTTRPDMGAGCEEKIDLKFLKFVWDYPNRSKPKVERLLRENQDQLNIVRLRTNAEVKEFLEKICTQLKIGSAANF